MLINKSLLRDSAGKQAAFAIIVDKYGPQIHAFISRLTGERETSRDLTQETFLKAWKNFDKFDRSKHIRPWLYKIALNLVRDHKRYSSREKESNSPAESMPDTSIVTPGEAVQTRQDAKSLHSALAKLPADAREAVTLRYFQDLPFSQLASILGLSEAAAKMRVYRGLERLQTILNKKTLKN